MIVSIIVAMDKRGGIGKNNRLPWRLAADLKLFKERTMGHHLIVGRKTFESIGSVLPGRQMIVVTRNQAFKPERCLVADSVSRAIELARERGESEVFVGGGAEVYRQALPLADKIYITRVDAIVDADTFFPEFDEAEWAGGEFAWHDADEKNQFPLALSVLERKR